MCHQEKRKTPNCLYIVFTILLLTKTALSDNETPWFREGRAALRRALHVARTHNTRLARNVVLFVGDGMGVSTVTAARIRAGQLKGGSGEENFLFFERFPHLALLKTYNTDAQVPDSAGTGTALLTGVKANSGVIGLDARVTQGNCTHVRNARVSTLLEAFTEQGLSTGIVTNSRVTHATPAASYAHTPHRAWEGDTDMRSAPADCQVPDIARQLVEGNPNVKVVLGGGRRYFLNNATVDPETLTVDPRQRADGRNLVDEWRRDKETRRLNHSYVWNKQQFDAVNPHDTDYLLGLFSPSHMDFDYSQTHVGHEPSLADMTEKAIRVLQKDRRGFFLLVEGARIDWGHHANSAYTALTETIALDEAVKTAFRLTDRRDTLMVVTADHSHAFTLQGYAPRGHDILGKSAPPAPGPLDGLPYSTLSYSNGPVYGRHDLTGVNTASPTHRQSGCVPLSVETHAGEDVAAWGWGPMAHLLHGTQEQNYVYHVMEYAACVASSQRFCWGHRGEGGSSPLR